MIRVILNQSAYDTLMISTILYGPRTPNEPLRGQRLGCQGIRVMAALAI